MSIYISETGINCLIFIIYPVDKGIPGALCLRYLYKYLLVFVHRLLLFCVLVFWCSIIRLISFLTISIWAVCLKQPHSRPHGLTRTRIHKSALVCGSMHDGPLFDLFWLQQLLVTFIFCWQLRYSYCWVFITHRPKIFGGAVFLL